MGWRAPPEPRTFLRLAFGATPRTIAQLVARRGLLIVAAGVAGGIAAALALTRFLTGLL